MEFNATMSPAEKMQNELAVDAFNKQNTVNGRKVSQELGKDDFLKLLLTQMSHQDPTAPVDNNQFIAQMAQFSSLEQMYNMSNGFNKLAAMLNHSEASETLGKNVEIDAGDSVVSGTVQGFTRGDAPQVMVNGTFYDMNKIKAVYEN